MSGIKIFIDTNVLIGVYKGDSLALNVTRGYELVISCISEIEMLSKRTLRNEIKSIKELISECEIINLESEIRETASELRRKYSIKTPDAIIAATSIYLSLPLITMDKDFRKIQEASLIILQ
ncbi:MAG: type II toxin-antitoxin system VapC family toxin [Fimbriimonadaceae bacterium]|nr:type II toxin-antitoxin system VapC family toxin [Chitinophagales bacterium]